MIADTQEGAKVSSDTIHLIEASLDRAQPDMVVFSGDQIFVEACNTAHNGDLVVAMIDDSATVKTFYKENGHIRLQPENDTMDPIIVDDCTIVGKVFGVFRLYK